MLPDEPIRRILLYVDGSEKCITAAQYGIVLAKKTGAELMALYVVNVSLLEELDKARILTIEKIDYKHDLEYDERRYLNYISELAQSKGIEIKTELIKGVVNKVVCQKIEEWVVDLLVIGELEPVLSRTDTYHDEAELILRKSKCSVLVVKDADKVERIFNTIEEN